MDFVDLRSDTVTHPTPAMRNAMASAEVGDDVYGEDPTINRLERLAASRLEKEAGLFVPSGTMGNLAAVLAHNNRGDEVILGNQSHTFLYEAGGIAALGGIPSYVIPNRPDGTLGLEDLRRAIRGEDVHFPHTRLIELENTQNRCGGVVLPLEYMTQVGALARENGLKIHLDGARIFHAATALGVPVAQVAKEADSVTFCLSKGLCAPVGSVLCGSSDFIYRARRIRKQLGGGMRQAGILAAAGLVALEQMTDRLAEDHRRARELAEGLAILPGVCLTYGLPQTNMVFVSLAPDKGLTAAQVAERLKVHKILVGVTGPYDLRLVTHFWIDDQSVRHTIEAFRKAIHHV